MEFIFRIAWARDQWDPESILCVCIFPTCNFITKSSSFEAVSKLSLLSMTGQIDVETISCNEVYKVPSTFSVILLNLGSPCITHLFLKLPGYWWAIQAFIQKCFHKGFCVQIDGKSASKIAAFFWSWLTAKNPSSTKSRGFESVDTAAVCRGYTPHLLTNSLCEK